MPSKVPTLPLQGAAKAGVELPVVASGCAFGNWVDPSVGWVGFKPEDANRALTEALDVAGVRAFDGAHFYQTEAIFGRLLGERFATGALKREDVWVQTKVACGVPGPSKFNPLRGLDYFGLRDAPEAEVAAAVKRQFWTSLDELGLGWVDMTLIHFPGPMPGTEAGQPKGALTETEARRLRRIIYTTLHAAFEVGATRAVGVSNFSVKHLRDLKADLPEGVPMPSINQVEVSPYALDRELVSGCKELGVVVQAYAPFASGAFGLLKDPVLVGLATAKGVTVGQIIQQWLWKQHGIASLPKSSNVERLKASVDLTSFTLSAAELASVDALSVGKEPRRICPAPSSMA